MTGKKIKFQNEAINGILVVDTNSESDAEVSDVEHDFEEGEEEEGEEEEENYDNKPQHKSKHRLHHVTDYQPGNRLKKEHKYSSFCQSGKRCEKKLRLHTSKHQQKQLTTVCVDVVLHRNFSSVGGTDQCILPATLRWTTKPSHRLYEVLLLDMMTNASLALQMGH